MEQTPQAVGGPPAVTTPRNNRRRWAIEALNETAVRELVLRGTPETFPGADEYADR